MEKPHEYRDPSDFPAFDAGEMRGRPSRYPPDLDEDGFAEFFYGSS